MSDGPVNRFKRNNGFTAVEMLVAMATAFILISVIYGVYHFSLRYPKVWNDKINLENTAWRIVQRFSQDLLEADEVQFIQDNEVNILSGTRVSMLYTIDEEKLYRNGVLLNDPPVRLQSFQLNPLEIMKKDMEPFSPDTVKGLQKETWTLALTLGSKKSTFTLETCVSPRRMDPMKRIFKDTIRAE